MAEEAIRKLELRISELEDQLSRARARPEPTDVSADEIKAYLKVRELVAVDWGEFCGPNDCMPVPQLCGPCIKWPSETISRCVPLCGCIFECFCGPCNIGPWSSGGLRRFSQLGG